MFLAVLLLLALSSACSTIGHSETFRVQRKEDVYDLYKLPLPEDPKEKAEIVAKRHLGLADIYRSNLPLVLTDAYDVRVQKSPIRAGDPLNIIINKIRVKDNKERRWLLENSSDVAVVVTVDDGKGAEPKHVIVAFERNVGQSVRLPDNDLIAYTTEAYNNEPVRIEVTLLALYGMRNKTYVQILGTAAGIGAAVAPAYAPAMSAAAQVGEALINAKQDSVIARFTFQLYPWKTGPTRALEELGVPRVAYGQYFLVNTPTPSDIAEVTGIQLGYDFRPYKVPASGKDIHDALAAGEAPVYPRPLATEPARQSFDVAYVVLTVDNTKLNEAQQIIARADRANRALADLAGDSAITMGRVQLVDGQLDDLKSKLRLQVAKSEFSRVKREPSAALNRLFAHHGDRNLSEADKGEILQMIREVLPPEATATDRATIDSLRTWFDKNKDHLIYRARTGQYCLPKASAKCD